MTACHVPVSVPIPRLISFSIGLAVVLAACTRHSEAGKRGEVLHSLDPMVHWARDVHLQENPDVINVSISVAPSGDGNFLVSDGQEQQVRIYAPDGTLRRTFGRRGNGPGEFQHITRALRLSDGRVLVADFTGPLTFFDSAGQKVLHTAPSHLGPVYNVMPINDSLVAFTGRTDAVNNSTLLHVWNLRRYSLVLDAFSVPVPRGFESAYAIGGVTTLAVRGDTIATLFALKDTIFLFRTDGRPLSRIPIQFRAFRRLMKPAPDDEFTSEAFKRWDRSYSTATGLFWMSDGSFLVQYYDRIQRTPEWRIAHVDRYGRNLAEVVGSPMLLGTLPGDSLVFQKPGSDTPDVWAIGTIASR